MTQVLNVIKPLNDANHTGTVIFLHGSGGSGSDTEQWLRLLKKDLAFPHLKIILPTAPLRPYNPLGGKLSNVWFNRYEINLDSPDHLETIEEACDDLKKIVQKEIDSGIPPNRIAIGGFSMGGAMALHMGYRVFLNIAGVFALSSFLSTTSIIYKELQKKKFDRLPPLYSVHGDRDELVHLIWSELTLEKLQRYGVSVKYTVLKDVYHEMTKKEINLLWDWIQEIIPNDK